MNEVSNISSFYTKIGLFWLNFSSLELMLRLVLHRRNNGNTQDPQLFRPFTVGEQLTENAVNNYDSFSQVCCKFNSTLKKSEKIDFSRIEKFRNAIAHGRIVGDGNNLTITKFSKSNNKTVRVEFSWTYSEQDLTNLIEELGEATQSISIKHLGATISA
ncbi:hypothetical protein [Aquidulcibacter sp.]|uniref:hypothetical protein n=1 Tax=Aquidulcibacter sp. TaxID=2052990 RepID=UPI0037C13182